MQIKLTIFFFNPSRITQLLKNHPKAMDTYNYENIRDGFRIILKKKKAILLCEALKIATVCLVCLLLFFRFYDSDHKELAEAFTIMELNCKHFFHVMLDMQKKVRITLSIDQSSKPLKYSQLL